jgi:hypothetical protein
VLLQTWVVAPVVVVSFAYTGWSLAPASARRWAAQQLLRLWLPAPLRQWAQARSAAASGCGCDGCDQKPLPNIHPSAKHAAEQALVFHPPNGRKRTKIKSQIGR